MQGGSVSAWMCLGLMPVLSTCSGRGKAFGAPFAGCGGWTHWVLRKCSACHAQAMPSWFKLCAALQQMLPSSSPVSIPCLSGTQAASGVTGS